MRSVNLQCNKKFFIRVEEQFNSDVLLTLVRQSDNAQSFIYLDKINIPKLQRENLAEFLCPPQNSLT